MAFQRIDQLNGAQTEDLFRLYQAEWWTLGRQLPDIELMLQNSDVVVAYCDSETGKLAAFGRVLTDYIYCAEEMLPFLPDEKNSITVFFVAPVPPHDMGLPRIRRFIRGMGSAPNIVDFQSCQSLAFREGMLGVIQIAVVTPPRA